MNRRTKSRRGNRPRSSRAGRRSWSRLSRRRSAPLFAVGCLIWVLVLSRLFFIQVIKGAEYKEISSGQHQRHIKLEAKRGEIRDRKGRNLVINLPVESFFAIPESVENVDAVARVFSSSGSGFRQLKDDLRTRKSFVWLKRRVEKEESRSYRQSNLQGVWVIGETKRYNLYGDLASEVLGFTDVDNRGLAGVELRYDSQLHGEDGKSVLQRDGHRNSYQIAEYPLQRPRDGKNLVLTIDIELQSIVEQELKAGIRATEADAGSAVFMDPKTGEILAMAYCGKDDGLPVKNRTLSDNFEPGSTFKIITAAAALEEGLLSPEDSIFAEKGEFRIGSKIIHDVKPLEMLSFKEGVVHSSNIVLAKIALRVGKDKLYQYARDFGIGEKTGIDLPGEGTGFIPAPRRWPDLVLACMGFGQGVSLTALQLACAYSAIANDGVLMKPFVVKAVLDEQGEVVNSVNPTPVRQVVSQKTAHILVDFLKGVVSSGSGQRAQMEGVNVCGKTGTAQKAKPNGGGYEQGSYIASFIGFFPAEDPRLVGLITLDNPRTEHLGGLTAAPVFKNAAQRIVSLSGESILTGAVSQIPTPDQPEETPDFMQEESSPSRIQAHDLFAQADTNAEGRILLPDVRGMTVREALRILQAQDIKWRLEGSGLVIDQIPEPNTPIKAHEECLLECRAD
jgi:cell division protein FtsI (penicillin-binding protein 3)